MAPGLAGIAGCAHPFSVDQPLALRLCRHPICRPMDLPALPRNNGPLVQSRKNACSARPSRPPSNGPGKRARRLPTWPPARLNLRMKGYGGPAQPSPLLGDALNAGYRYLEVKCDGCSTHSAVDLTIISSARRRRFGNSNSARVASRARSNAAIPTNAAIWCDCGVARSRRKTTADRGIPAISVIAIDAQA